MNGQSANLRSETMNKSNTDALQRFISLNKLNVNSGPILFDAAVIYYREQLSNTIGSQVQIITLPNQMAIYIYEFLKLSYQRSEMYNTENFIFHCTSGGTLKVSEIINVKNPYLLAILPL